MDSDSDVYTLVALLTELPCLKEGGSEESEGREWSESWDQIWRGPGIVYYQVIG